MTVWILPRKQFKDLRNELEAPPSIALTGMGQPPGDPLGAGKTRQAFELPSAERKTIDLEGRVVKDGVRRGFARPSERNHGLHPGQAE
jgi:hypothetical protein